MKAAVWHGRQDVRIEKVNEPSAPPPGQVQVKVAWCGICGTDLHEYMGGPLYIPLDRPHSLTGVQAPVIIGHEMSGEITAVGEGVAGFAVGDRVVAIEMAERRIEAAKLCGADAVIDPSREDPEKRALEMTNGQGFDLVMECAGQPGSVLMAGKLTRTRGRLVIMGVFEKPAAIDLTDVVFREKTISGSMSGYGLYDETIRIMTDPRFRGDLLITDRIGLDDLIGKGYYGLLNEKDKHVKMLVRPDAA